MPDIKTKPRYVAGVGASAGGLEALQNLFENMPLQTGISFVVVQHLSPDYKSMMDSLLKRRTSIPISIAEDQMVLKPDHIYLLPPQKEIIIAGNKLLLKEREDAHGVNHAINTFFQSLAQNWQEKSIAVVLSGSGSDGTQGILDVHDSGGMVIAQSPETCKFDSMPQSVINTRKVDLVLPPEEIGAAIVRFTERTHQYTKQVEIFDSSQDDNRLAEVIIVLRNKFGLDFSQYKPSTIIRRIERRLLINKITKFDSYVNFLLSDTHEAEALYYDLLIGVTQFFRDPDCFDILRQQVEKLINTFEGDDEIRVWVAGCAGGHEAYSIAILIDDVMEEMGVRKGYKIFATDVHKKSLTNASQGIYSSEELEHLTKSYLNKYFTKLEDGRYKVISTLRNRLVFAVHNILEDPPFTKIHLISCRNLLIYLQQPAQNRVINLFAFSLNKNGVLFLGPSESVLKMQNVFEVVSQSAKIFTKGYAGKLSPITLARSPLLKNKATRLVDSHENSTTHHSLKRKRALEALLEAYVPPSILINREGEVLQIFGNAREYLSMDIGVPSLNIRSMVGAPAKSIFSQILSPNRHYKSVNIVRGVQGFFNHESVDIEIRPLSKDSEDSEYFLLSFIDTLPAEETAKGVTVLHSSQSAEQIKTIEEELEFTQQNLQSTIEELETSNEELQASNEELQASNEELQSTNEELQSVNEELHTVNVEFKIKEKERERLEADEKNILQFADFGIIILNAELRIYKTSREAQRTFDIKDGDINKPYSAVFPGNITRKIKQVLPKILESGAQFEREVTDTMGGSLRLKMRPYFSSMRTIQGVVISLIDITAVKEMRRELVTIQKSYEHVIDQFSLGIFNWDNAADCPIFTGNFLKSLGYQNRKKVTWQTLLRDQALSFQGLMETPEEWENGALHSIQKIYDALGNGHWFSICITSPSPNNFVGIALNVSHIYDEKAKLEKTVQALSRSNKLLEQFAFIVSHDLKTPLRHMSNYMSFLEQAVQDGNMDKVKQNIGFVKKNANRLQSLVDDIITISRITSQKCKLGRVDLNVLAQKAIDSLDLSIMKAKAHIDTQKLPVIRGDEPLLQQLFINLFENALKYNNNERAEISVHAKEEPFAYLIEVRDNGIGFDVRDPDIIFEPFKRLVSKDEYEGSGIGLAICKTVMDHHNGKIRVTSKKGEGTTFILTFPK